MPVINNSIILFMLITCARFFQFLLSSGQSAVAWPCLDKYRKTLWLWNTKKRFELDFPVPLSLSLYCHLRQSEVFVWNRRPNEKKKNILSKVVRFWYPSEQQISSKLEIEVDKEARHSRLKSLFCFCFIVLFCRVIFKTNGCQAGFSDHNDDSCVCSS